jgi:hypothetical protein
MPSIINATTSTGLVSSADNSGSLQLATNNGTTAVTIDTSQNVGIGISPSQKLDVNGNQRLIGDSAYLLWRNTADNASSGVIQFPSASVATIGTYVNQAMLFQTNNTERMRIDSSGNVGIGVTNPSSFYSLADNLVLGAGTGSHGLTIYSGSDSSGYIGFNDTVSNSMQGFIQYNHSGDYMAFAPNGSERMRITSGGEVYIAGTADQGAYNLQCNGTGVWGAGAYVNGSDARIKEDIAPIQSGLDVVEKLNPVTYRYKEEWSKDQSTQTGFIAQELLTALDGQVYVDGIVQQGGEYMSVAYQNIIPILTKSIQELNAKVEAQAVRIAELEGAR